MDNIFIYIHVCCINNWKEVFNGLLFDIRKSGLYVKTREIRCYVLSENIDQDLLYLKDDKIKIIGYSSNLKLYEVVSINTLYKDSLNETENAYVLYLHTKGVTKDYNNLNVKDWVELLCYFNIYKHEECLNKLVEGYDAVSVNLYREPWIHFAGNFWWSSFNHIKKLQMCTYSDYFNPEKWICDINNSKYCGLFNSNCAHYTDRYLKDNYINKYNLTYIIT